MDDDSIVSICTEIQVGADSGNLLTSRFHAVNEYEVVIYC